MPAEQITGYYYVLFSFAIVIHKFCIRLMLYHSCYQARHNEHNNRMARGGLSPALAHPFMPVTLHVPILYLMISSAAPHDRDRLLA